MRAVGTPQGLVIHAGSSLWPQLDALAQWGDSLRVLRLVLAHGDEAPGGPAERIRGFVATNLPHVVVELSGMVNDDDPLETAAAIQAATADGGSWLVDLSGGTRLMFAGGVLAARRCPEVPVVFRDPEGPWYQIQASGSARQLEGQSSRAIERFTVEGLLRVTWADAERHVRVVHSRIEPEIQRAAARLLERTGRDWHRELNRATSEIARHRGPRTSQGSLFEQMVLSLLRQMGVADDDSALGVSLHDHGTDVQEVDVVVNSNGWLHVIDCKLSEVDRPRAGTRVAPPPLGMQIREAFATGRLLGDGGNQFILMRPLRALSEEFRSLCDEYEIRVVDRITLSGESLPSVLQRLVHPPRVGEVTRS